jgi:CRP-like cAMP-binding protein
MACNNLERGQVIYIEDGSPGSDIYILLFGAARLSSTTGSHARGAIAIISPGVIFKCPPLPAMIGNHFRCEAIRPSRVGRVSRDVFLDISLGVRSVNFDRLILALFGEVGSMMVRYPGFLGYDLRTRVALTLMHLGNSFGARNSHGTVLTITPTQQEIADLVGASRPKISIVLGEFERRRAIYREGRRLAIVSSRLEELTRIGGVAR